MWCFASYGWMICECSSCLPDMVFCVCVCVYVCVCVCVCVCVRTHAPRKGKGLGGSSKHHSVSCRPFLFLHNKLILGVDVGKRIRGTSLCHILAFHHVLATQFWSLSSLSSASCQPVHLCPAVTRSALCFSATSC